MSLALCVEIKINCIDPSGGFWCKQQQEHRGQKLIVPKVWRRHTQCKQSRVNSKQTDRWLREFISFIIAAGSAVTFSHPPQCRKYQGLSIWKKFYVQVTQWNNGVKDCRWYMKNQEKLQVEWKSFMECGSYFYNEIYSRKIADISQHKRWCVVK